MKTAKKGVTLVELLIVMLIMGVLAFVAVPRMGLATIVMGKSQTAANTMAAAIRHSRTLAITKAAQYPQGFSLNMTGPSSSYTGFRIVNVQTGQVVESGTIPSKVTCTTDGDGIFWFGPFGNSTGGTGNLTISIIGGGKSSLISVVSATGMVKCTEQ